MTEPNYPTPLGELGAEVFLERLRGQAFRSSNRHVVDYLPSDVARHVFEALIELTDESISVRISDNGSESNTVNMRVIRSQLDGFDLLPYLVVQPEAADGTPNRGTDGFASTLRDQFAVGATRPRLLVVFTEQVIETQKSAQDALADAQLVTIDNLLQRVCDRACLSADSPLRQVAVVYRAYQPDDASWLRVVEDFERFVETVAELAPEEQGACLPMLRCFLPDARPDFVDGEAVKVLESKEERRRSRGSGRLFDNALLHEFLTETFNDPIADPERELADLLEDDPDKAKEIARGGITGLETLDLKTFAGMDQKRIKRKKNGFDVTILDVDGASFSRLSSKARDKILAVTTLGSFSVTVGLVRALDTKKERPQIVTWDRVAKKLQPKVLQNATDGADQVTFDIEVNPADTFLVCRLALTKGPRSVRSPIDAIYVAVYVGNAAETVVEEGLRLDLETQAWIAEGEPRFIRYTAVGSSAVEVEHQEPATEQPEEAAFDVREVLLEDTGFVPRVVDEAPDTKLDDDSNPVFVESVVELGCTTTRLGYGTTRVMRTKDHYLDSIDDVREVGDKYAVDFGGNEIRYVWGRHEAAQDPFLYGRAVGQLILRPQRLRIERRETDWYLPEVQSSLDASVTKYIDARSRLLADLKNLAENRISRFRRAPESGAVPITLLPLHHVRESVYAVLETWSNAVAESFQRGSQFGFEHDLLLQTDTLRIISDDDRLEALVVLPTHPWLIAALLAFQYRFAKNIRTAQERKRTVLPSWKFELERSEVEQMMPLNVIERWYLWENQEAALVLASSRIKIGDFRNFDQPAAELEGSAAGDAVRKTL